MNHSHPDTNMEEDSHNQEDSLLTPNVSSSKGGLRTMPFIIVNESTEMLVSNGLSSNMILYLTKDYHMANASGTSILSLWSAFSNFLTIFGAFVSDSYLGRFRVVGIGSIFSVLGTILLWLTAMFPGAKPPPCNSSNICESATAVQLVILLSAFGCMSIGSGCIRPCSMAFGADQLVKKGNGGKNEAVLASFFNWYYASISVSTIFALTLVVYIQNQFGWQVGFGVPAIFMFCSAIFFFVGSPLYVKVMAQKSFFTGLVQVFVVAFKNRHLALPPNTSSDGYYCQSKDSKLSTPSESLRCLNKACVIKDQEDLHPNGSVAKPWNLCTVDQVEDLKSLIRIIPIWSTGIMNYVTISQSIPVLQASSMNRYITSNLEIPAASFGVVTIIALLIWIAFYDRVVIPIIKNYTGRPNGISAMHRAGIGLFITCIAMAVASIVEAVRRRIAIEEGLADDPDSVVNMSAMWLALQFCLQGVAEAFNAVGQIEFYYTYLPKGMSSMASAMFTLGGAFASLLASLIINIVNSATGGEGRVSWLDSNLNKGHYDYYYALLTFLCLLNFVYFLICCRAYGNSDKVKAGAYGEIEDLRGGLLSKSGEFPSTSSA